VEIEPDNAIYHFNLGAVKRYAPGDRQLTMLESLQERSANLSGESRIYLHFALAKAYEDIGENDRSFDQLLTGNALKRRVTEYDEAKVLAQIGAIHEVFTAELVEAMSVSAAPDGAIFILGMPRSGSTLVEHILASHSQVHGAGESNLFPRAVNQTWSPHGYPRAIRHLSVGDLGGLGLRYNTTLKAVVATSKRIADKLLRNFLYCGLIHLALPNARIIHTRRNPIDTCLSCFSKLFVGHHPYTYNLGELGRYYRAYEVLMEHWRSILPKGILIDVNYEDVVGDVESQARRILDHCGLAWEEGCLSFHLSRRPVRTASARQVRQPIYNTSVNRWRPSAILLKPLTDHLGMAP
jgi:Sulfotransferase family